MEIRLSPHEEMLLEQYRELLPQLRRLAKKVYDQLFSVLAEQGVQVNSIENRVKSEDSLIGKLERKGQKYKTISDITDLVGMRVITYYTDDVDKVAAIAKRMFDIDWDNSVDKRKLHQLTSFGYNSLHYVCHLKKGDEDAEIPFELQMRTALQHVWSAIEHDIGYKGLVKLPPKYRRQFSRLAGMLELADNEFSRLRTTMSDYRRQVQALVKSGELSEVILSTDSFQSYLELHPFDRLNQRIAAVNQAEIIPASLLPFLPILESFSLETLGDVETFISENEEDAYQLALSQLAVTDLDILSETVGIQNLCFVKMLKNGGGRIGLKFIYDTLYGVHDVNGMLADEVLRQASKLRFYSMLTAK